MYEDDCHFIQNMQKNITISNIIIGMRRHFSVKLSFADRVLLNFLFRDILAMALCALLFVFRPISPLQI